MYVIIVYDMKSDRTRKPRTLLRQYLTHTQNSVFEGNITEGDLKKIQPKLKKITEENESIIIYKFRSKKFVERIAHGNDPTEESQFI